jgi:hypothetical protein
MRWKYINERKVKAQTAIIGPTALDQEAETSNTFAAEL